MSNENISELTIEEMERISNFSLADKIPKDQVNTLFHLHFNTNKLITRLPALGNNRGLTDLRFRISNEVYNYCKIKSGVYETSKRKRHIVGLLEGISIGLNFVGEYDITRKISDIARLLKAENLEEAKVKTSEFIDFIADLENGYTERK